MTESPPRLHGVCDLREFFRTNQTPVYFVSPTAFSLLGIDRAEFAGTPPIPEQPAPVTPTSFKMA
jgi:hypothetical protein